MKISKSRIDYFLDKKDNEYNPNLDSFNLSAKGYNQAIKDVKKEIEKIADFEEITFSDYKTNSFEEILMKFKYGLISNHEGIRLIKQTIESKH